MQIISPIAIIDLWLVRLLGWCINILALIWIILWIAKRYVRDSLWRSIRCPR